jgi:hypothetical protein
MLSEDFQAILESALDGRATVTENREPNRNVDAWLEMHIERNVWHLAVEQKAATGNSLDEVRARHDHLRARQPDVVPILAVPRLSKRDRQALKDHQINHMDLAGNIWIRGPGLVVNTEGSRPLETRRPPKGRNPFSKKASLVARVLLAHPSAPWRVRDLAEEASLSVGYASEVLRSLVERGYAAEGADGFRLEDPVALLTEWAGVYRWDDNETHSFVAPLGKTELTQKTCGLVRDGGAKCLFTLLSAADRVGEYVEHDQVHLYASNLTRELANALRSELYAEPVQQGGNLHILKPYYGDAVWYAAEPVNGEQSVSDVQLFLDLVHYPVRGPETAAALLKQRLGPRLKLSREQVRTLREGLGL